MDRIQFKVNGEKCLVGSEVTSDVSLVDYLREYKELRGTKYMCREGGCGACIVAVTALDPHTGCRRIFSVNSCLISVTQCEDWEITTVEGLGDRLKGYHPVQRTLAEYNGTQCGYCSVGWVMAMYSLLESRNYDLTQKEIEDSFGSNNCRCTGYRPILDAFKSFAKDAPAPNKHIPDIEDLHLCKKKEKGCETLCREKDWCWVTKGEADERVNKKIVLKDERIWYRVSEVQDVFDVLRMEGVDSYMLVAGNTAKGAYHIFEYPRVLIDIGGVLELKKFYLDQNLVIGGGVTLTDLLEILQNISKEFEEFSYLEKLYEHLLLVAHIPVRNVGTIAGNLMLKHRVPTFSSDVFLLLETIGATVTIVDMAGVISEVTPEHFTGLDMTGKIILNVKLPPLSRNYKFVSFKVMPRSQNAHAHVNAAFLYEFETPNQDTVVTSRIVIGGLSAKFVHASNTEKFLVGKKLFTNEVLQNALKVLDEELVVDEIAGEHKADFRRKVAFGLFYKGLLVLIPEKLLKPQYLSGVRDLRKTRPLSKAKEVYDTNPIIWPITEPTPKVEALIQCAGEMKYCNDMPKQPQEVFAAFVTADVGKGEIIDIDPTPALKIPGVLAFFSAKDIPGKNTFMTPYVAIIIAEEEILSNGSVKYYDQAIGIIVAESEALANRAALLVHVKYKTVKEPPIMNVRDALARDPSRINVFLVLPAKDAPGADVQKVIKGSNDIYSQYPYTMETQSCIARPSSDGIDVFTAAHWPDLCHMVTAEALNIQQNRVNMQMCSNGGSYGAKLSRACHVATACSLVTYLMNRPCRFIMSIQANMRVVGKRTPGSADFEVAVNNSGEIQYLEMHYYQDKGYVISELLIILTATDIKNVYDNRRWSSKLFIATTDMASYTWIRSPGSLEGIAMTEYIMEQISYELYLDPLEVRMKNINREEKATQEIVDKLVKDSEYYKRKEDVKEFNKSNRWKKRGLRVALMSWHSAFMSDFQVLLIVYHGDGSVVVKHGAVELGQGVNTKIIQIVAYTLNIPMDKVKVKPTDVSGNPNNIATGGSRGTDTVCLGAIKCCQILLDRLAQLRETLNNPTWEVLIQAAYKGGINLQTSYHTTANDVNTYRVQGAAVAEVELDVLTGEHEIIRVDLIEDCGTSTNPELDIGQIEGAFMMGVGYWTSEDLIYDKSTGELLTDRTWFYHIPLAKDIPIDFRIQLRRNSYNPVGLLGSKAVSEPPICLSICVAFALREAIAASREDSGYPRNEWFSVDGPYTLEKNVLKADVKLGEFLFN